MAAVLCWGLYLLSAIVLLFCWWQFVTVLSGIWPRMLLRFSLFGLLLTPVSLLFSLGQPGSYAPALTVLLFQYWGGSLHSVDTLMVLLLGMWLAVMAGVATLFICRH